MPRMYRQIADDLRACGLRRGGVVLVHSSLSSLGHVDGGAETVVQGLLEALGPEGTLLMPALSYAQVTPTHPAFDVRHTPSCVGVIPEHFRTRPGTLRSLNPTHSVCGVGPQAAEMLGPHVHDGTPCGPHSPYRLLRDVGGQLVMLGCGLRPNTSMHAIEEIADSPYLWGAAVEYRMTLADGQQVLVANRRHGFVGWDQRYDRLEPLMGESEMRVGHCLRATVHVLETPAMWERALAAHREDPFHFVDPVVG